MTTTPIPTRWTNFATDELRAISGRLESADLNDPHTDAYQIAKLRKEIKAELERRRVHTPPEFDIYRIGLCYASVCSSLPVEEVKARMAAEWTGVSPWTLSSDPEFANGQPNPCPCETAPETHTHYLFNC